MPLNPHVSRDALSAWQALEDAGCLDLDDRDEDLLIRLKDQLDPLAPDLPGALAEATTDACLIALFSCVQPFVAMVRFRSENRPRGGVTAGHVWAHASRPVQKVPVHSSNGRWLTMSLPPRS